MGRITTTFTVSMPPEMAEQIELVRMLEHRTRSELVREAMRIYLARFEVIHGTCVDNIERQDSAEPRSQV